MNGFGIGLLDEGDVREMLNERLDSRQWWVIVNGEDLTTIVEDRHYGGHGDLFELVLVPGFPILSIALAHKSRLSAEQLATCVIEAGGQHNRDELASDLADHDVLFPGPDLLHSAASSVAFQRLVDR